MIARVWRGATRLKDADRYHEHLLATGVRDYRATPRNRGVYVLRRSHAGAAEFVIVTFWDSMDAVRHFAGPDPERAVYYPEDALFLLTMEPNVAHYEVLPEQPVGAKPKRVESGLAMDFAGALAGVTFHASGVPPAAGWTASLGAR